MSASTAVHATGDAMSAETTTGSAMHMETTGKGPPDRRLAAFVAGQTSWDCNNAHAANGAMKTVECMTQVPHRLQVSVFDSQSGLTRAYQDALRRQGRGLAPGTGRCSATSWHGEMEWVHGIGEPGGRAFCYLDVRAGASHLVWSSRLGTPTLYDATLESLDHRTLYFWWSNFRHELF